MTSHHTPDLHTFPLTGPIGLSVRLGHGSITVTTREGLDSATVRFASRSATTDALERCTAELQGSTLVVTGPRQGGLADLVGGWKRERDAIDVEIQVPAGTPVKAMTATADLRVIGPCGTADLTLGKANAELATVDGDLRLRGGQGTFSIGDVHGSVQVRAGNGVATLGVVDGALDSGFGKGDLVVASVGGAVRARAGSGSAALGSVAADVDVALGSGSIRVGIPHGVSARVNATSGNGQVRSDLPVDQAPTSPGRTITVRAQTGSGEVRFERPDVAA